MRTASVHWLLIVCFLAVPLSEGATTQQRDRHVVSGRGRLTAILANRTGAPQPLSAQASCPNIYPALSCPIGTPDDLSPWFISSRVTRLVPRRSEVPTIQPAGP